VIDTLRRHWFTLGLLGVIALALLDFSLPAPGVVVPVGIWIIFLAQGMGLGEDSAQSGHNWRGMLTFIVSWNFLLFPILTVSLLLLAGLWGRSEFCFGYWLLAFLPTTIASAIAMTAAAGGRVGHALLATVSSNLLAVWVVPAAAVFFLTIETQIEIELVSLVLRLACLIMLPLAIGYSLRRLQLRGTGLVAGLARPLTQGVLLLIIFASFSHSVATGQLADLSLGSLLELLLVCGVLLLFVSCLVWFSAGRCRFTHGERVAAFYCASQKSLATGVPMIGSVLLAVGPENASALTLLPILCYSPMQLLLGGLLVSSFSKE
jgi:sodium/bile acid cotransporter 7